MSIPITDNCLKNNSTEVILFLVLFLNYKLLVFIQMMLSSVKLTLGETINLYRSISLLLNKDNNL